jgi:hypothetical protein
MSTRTEWEELRAALEALRRSVGEEIRVYPAPITACDAQFNHLLELRRLLPEELMRLEAAANDATATVEDFLRTSPCGTHLSAMLRSVAAG